MAFGAVMLRLIAFLVVAFFVPSSWVLSLALPLRFLVAVAVAFAPIPTWG